MFIYSLSGLELAEGEEGMEIEDNEITARSQTYQLLGRFFTSPDADHYERAREGLWVKELREVNALMPFEFEIPDVAISEDVSLADYQAQFTSAFEGSDNGLRALLEGRWQDNREQTLEELVRAYEYFGLGSAGTDEMPLDHIATQCDFMQILTFKEAASPSPRLASSYRRAQLSFLEQHLTVWVPQFVDVARAANPSEYMGWALDLLARFVPADFEYIS